MHRLLLRPTTFDDGPRKNDFAVIWASDEYGARRLGRVRLTGEHDGAERWEWAINPPMPVHAWARGLARSRELATAAFRRAFENFHRETAARQWADAFHAARR
jgi:hypothetical protein